MTTGALTTYRSDMRAGRDGFGQLLRAEWTKFRTVRGSGCSPRRVTLSATAMPAIPAFRPGPAARP